MTFRLAVFSVGIAGGKLYFILEYLMLVEMCQEDKIIKFPQSYLNKRFIFFQISFSLMFFQTIIVLGKGPRLQHLSLFCSNRSP